MSSLNRFTKILIEPTTDAAISPVVTITQDLTSFTLIANGFASDEEANLEIYDAAQDDWYNALDNGTPIVLNEDINVIAINSWGQYRVNKPETASPVGLTSVQFNNSTLP